MNAIDAGATGAEDLEALFDAVAGQRRHNAYAPVAQDREPPVHDAQSCPAGEVMSRLGQLTRAFHDALRQLGYDRLLEQAAQTIPDARDRLNYVAAMTEQAAERVLNAVEAAKPIQERLGRQAEDLATRWDALYEGRLDVEGFKRLAAETRTYLKEVTVDAYATGEKLLEIMMAQDFQDLTGQVIKRIVELARNLESQLVQLLLDISQGELKPAAPLGADRLLNGPVVNPSGRDDVMTSQDQVDELLESLGF
jgi:chemotaxis protein CheZ